jgi:Ca2+-binding EF-hand superfamily protein
MSSADKIETLTAFFNWVDANNDGLISVEEIKEACAVDLDGDGVITEAEKIQSARQWIETNFPLQDANGDQLISLQELLEFNNK